MKTTIGELRETIRDALQEFGAPRGKLRRPGRNSTGGQQYKVGFTPDENRELSAFEASKIFPGSVDAWCEVAGEIAPELSDNPFVIRKRTAFFQIGDKLRAALEANPQHELAEWRPEVMDWFEI